MAKIIRFRLREILQEKAIPEWTFFRRLQTKTNIHPPTYNKLINNKLKRAPLELLATICEELEVDISQLMVLEDSPPACNK